jgi:PASTA domain
VTVDQTKDAEENVFRTTSPARDPGAWWFGIRARDNAGNWTDTVVIGPFVITGAAPVCNVPRLRGLTLIGAKRQLVKRGCALGRVTRAYSRRVARGRVIAQKRTPGLRLKRGSKIAVVLSRGRKRR